MVTKLKPILKGAKKMATQKKPVVEKKERKPREAGGTRRAVVVQLENGTVRNLAPYCKEKKLSVGTVYLRLKKRLADSTDDAVLIRWDDTVLCADRRPSSLKVIAIKDATVCRMQYADAIQHGAELIICSKGWKASDSQTWQAFADSLPADVEPVIENESEPVAEVTEVVEEEDLVS